MSSEKIIEEIEDFKNKLRNLIDESLAEKDKIGKHILYGIGAGFDKEVYDSSSMWIDLVESLEFPNGESFLTEDLNIRMIDEFNSMINKVQNSDIKELISEVIKEKKIESIEELKSEMIKAQKKEMINIFSHNVYVDLVEKIYEKNKNSKTFTEEVHNRLDSGWEVNESDKLRQFILNFEWKGISFPQEKLNVITTNYRLPWLSDLSKAGENKENNVDGKNNIYVNKWGEKESGKDNNAILQINYGDNANNYFFMNGAFNNFEGSLLEKNDLGKIALSDKEMNAASNEYEKIIPAIYEDVGAIILFGFSGTDQYFFRFLSELINDQGKKKLVIMIIHDDGKDPESSKAKEHLIKGLYGIQIIRVKMKFGKDENSDPKSISIYDLFLATRMVEKGMGKEVEGKKEKLIKWLKNLNSDLDFSKNLKLSRTKFFNISSVDYRLGKFYSHIVFIKNIIENIGVEKVKEMIAKGIEGGTKDEQIRKTFGNYFVSVANGEKLEIESLKGSNNSNETNELHSDIVELMTLKEYYLEKIYEIIKKWLAKWKLKNNAESYDESNVSNLVWLLLHVDKSALKELFEKIKNDNEKLIESLNGFMFGHESEKVAGMDLSILVGNTELKDLFFEYAMFKLESEKEEPAKKEVYENLSTDGVTYQFTDRLVNYIISSKDDDIIRGLLEVLITGMNHKMGKVKLNFMSRKNKDIFKDWLNEDRKQELLKEVIGKVGDNEVKYGEIIEQLN